jgi:hypothetical protein
MYFIAKDGNFVWIVYAGSANSVFGSRSAMDARLMVDELHNVVSESTDGYM